VGNLRVERGGTENASLAQGGVLTYKSEKKKKSVERGGKEKKTKFKFQHSFSVTEEEEKKKKGQFHKRRGKGPGEKFAGGQKGVPL